MCGTPAFTVFHTPLRLMSIMSVQSASLVLSSVVTAVADAGVGDDDVQAAQLLDAGVDRCLQRVVVAHVDLGGVDAAVVALDQIRGLGQILRCRWRDPASVDNCLQMSTAMMSAPSCANRTAWRGPAHAPRR